MKIQILFALVCGFVASAQADFQVNNGATPIDSSIGVSVVLHEKLPELSDYECPLFSNSPYTEIISSLDKMQDQINKTFTNCSQNKANEQLNTKSREIRQQILDTQQAVKNNQTFKVEQLSLNLQNSALELNKLLTAAAQTKVSVCYSEVQSRNIIFSINETFQGIAPVILDVMGKFPSVATKLGPAAQVLAGAEVFSKGLSLIEQIAKDSVLINMNIPENRTNTLKNVCQFMKLYNRLEYLRIQRLEGLQSVMTQYQSEIKEINTNLEALDKSSKENLTGNLSANTPAAAFTPTKNDDVQNYEVVSDAKATLVEMEPKLISGYKLADAKLDEVSYSLATSEKLNDANLAKCEIYSNLSQAGEFDKVLLDSVEFSINIVSYKGSIDFSDKQVAANLFSQATEVAGHISTLKEQILTFKNKIAELKNTKSNSDCVKYGEDYLKIVSNILVAGRSMISLYDSAAEALNPSKESGATHLNEIAYAGQLKQQVIQNKKEQVAQKLVNAVAEQQTMIPFLKYAKDFEASEVEQQARGMHRYFFSGPDVFKSSCDSNPDQCDKWWSGAVGYLKGAYALYRNQGGPVYELLRNKESAFNDEYFEMQKALGVVAAFESGFAEKELGRLVGTQATAKKFIETRKKYISELPHLNLNYLVIGSAQHTNLCNNINQALNKYLISATHLMSNRALCDMVYPVLKDNSKFVSPLIKYYCVPQPHGVFSSAKSSRLQSLDFKMLGRTSDDMAYSPTSMIDKLLVKRNSLKCKNSTTP